MAGHCPARGFTEITILRGNRLYGFPLWGKLSPQVTDEGTTAGHFPLIRRVPRHLSPKGEGFFGGVGHPALYCSTLRRRNALLFVNTEKISSQTPLVLFTLSIALLR